MLAVDLMPASSDDGSAIEARQRNKDRMNERVKNAGDGIHSAKWREK